MRNAVIWFIKAKIRCRQGQSTRWKWFDVVTL